MASPASARGEARYAAARPAGERGRGRRPAPLGGRLPPAAGPARRGRRPPPPPLRIWDADDGRLRYGRVAVQDRLDLAGRDVLAAADDDVLQAAGDEQVAVLVQEAHGALLEPAVPDAGG